MLDEVEKALRGEPAGPLDGRSIQPYLTYKLAQLVKADLTLSSGENHFEIAAK